MLKVIAEEFICTEAIEIVLPLYRELVASTKMEPLCISYDLYVDEKDPGHFIFIEEWPDREALNKHCASEHFQRIVPMIDKYKKAEPKFILMGSVFDNK
ncbi:putative quinol monooxygenase [Providencia sneebia]|uniref:Antibiotic biosynthesis monooxygenase n=1 Tax=Providencia sneebia DSM 19967 TaxID=1141660 RepID=K8WC35_9GAMM|nr:putative quinol monooxygenase [Providencia sneebia]EKT57436.1 antibiotic biosynthesis monooxygenase [Providencia sneebia DSM 19967]